MSVRLPTTALDKPLITPPLPDGEGVSDCRITIGHDLKKGQSRRIALGGITIYRGRHRFTRDVLLHRERDAPMLALHFNFGPASALGVRPLAHTMAYLPERALPVCFEADRDYEAFEVNLTRAYLTTLIRRHPRLLDPIHPALAYEEPLHTPPRPITLRLREIIREMEESSAYGDLRAAFLEAKVLELLILHLAPSASREAGASALSQRDADRMWEARQILLARITAPPSLVELAHQVGTNEFKLKRDFKTLFGTTVFGMLRQHRMEQARALLLDTDLSIEEIAERVGYRHGSHFSTAFKRAFGHPPRALQSR